MLLIAELIKVLLSVFDVEAYLVIAILWNLYSVFRPLETSLDKLAHSHLAHY